MVAIFLVVQYVAALIFAPVFPMSDDLRTRPQIQHVAGSVLITQIAAPLSAPHAVDCTFPESSWNPCAGLTKLGEWLGKVVAGVIAFVFMILLLQHATKSPPDLKAAGIDLVLMAVFAGLAVKGDVIVTAAMKLFN